MRHWPIRKKDNIFPRCVRLSELFALLFLILKEIFFVFRINPTSLQYYPLQGKSLDQQERF